MSLLDKDPYSPIVRAAMNRHPIDSLIAIDRQDRYQRRVFRIAGDQRWGKRLEPVSSYDRLRISEIVRI